MYSLNFDVQHTGIELGQNFLQKSDVFSRVRKSQIFEQKSAKVRTLEKWLLEVSICDTLRVYITKYAPFISRHTQSGQRPMFSVVRPRQARWLESLRAKGIASQVSRLRRGQGRGSVGRAAVPCRATAGALRMSLLACFVPSVRWWL